MPWMSQTRRAPRHRGRELALLLMALVAALSGMVAGCATPSASNTAPTPDLHFVLDNNFLAAKGSYDLRYTLVALGARDGHVAWRRPLEGSNLTDATGILVQPIYQNGLVYVSYYYQNAPGPAYSVQYGVVEALEATTGAVRWRQDLGADTESAGEPVIDGATMYACMSVSQASGQPPSGLLEALDAQTGALRWKRPVAGMPGIAATEKDRVYVIANSQQTSHLLALSARDGSVAWDYTSDVPLFGGAAVQNSQSNALQVVGGRLYVQATERNADGTANMKLLALNASDGSVAWQRQTGGLTAAPAFNQSGDTLCLNVYVPSTRSSTILGLATSNGSTRWNITETSGIVSGCVASGDTFYLTQRSSDLGTGSVLALNSQDGRQLWKTPTAPPVAAAGLIAPAISNGVVGVYLAGPVTTQGQVMSTIAMLQASDGKILWQRDVDGRPEKALDIEGDLIFNSAQSGVIYSLTAYARATGAAQWSYTMGRL